MIGYRKLDGSTVLPDGTIVYVNGSRSNPGASPYPPPVELGGLHPITLPDPIAAPSPLAGIEAEVPAHVTVLGAEDRVRELELSLERASRQYATEKRRTMAVGIGALAVFGLGATAWYYGRKR